jgi:hypothetical protein
LHFSAEDEAVQSPVTIPGDAWAILKADESVRTASENVQDSAIELPRSWFSAAVVHLRSPAEDDLLVEAEGKLRGANVNQFWVFLRTPAGMKLVVNGTAHDLQILTQRRNGYRMIELDSLTCCTISTTWLRYERGEFHVFKRKITKVHK